MSQLEEIKKMENTQIKRIFMKAKKYLNLQENSCQEMSILKINQYLLPKISELIENVEIYIDNSNIVLIEQIQSYFDQIQILIIKFVENWLNQFGSQQQQNLLQLKDQYKQKVSQFKHFSSTKIQHSQKSIYQTHEHNFLQQCFIKIEDIKKQYQNDWFRIQQQFNNLFNENKKLKIQLSNTLNKNEQLIEDIQELKEQLQKINPFKQVNYDYGSFKKLEEENQRLKKQLCRRKMQIDTVIRILKIGKNQTEKEDMFVKGENRNIGLMKLIIENSRVLSKEIEELQGKEEKQLLTQKYNMYNGKHKIQIKKKAI